MADPFIGEIRMFACNFAPQTWAFCNGQLLPIAQNTALFSILGTTYGGDGRTTVGLPNLQGRAPMHYGHGPGLTQRRLGQAGGTSDVTLTADNMPSHTHTVRGVAAPASSFGPGTTGSAVLARSVGGAAYTSGSASDELAAAAVGNTGGGQAHTNLQPYQVVSFCIALQGLFPSEA